MAISRKIRYEAEDKKVGLTLGDLASFVEQAQAANVPPGTAVEGRSTIRDKITELEVG